MRFPVAVLASLVLAGITIWLVFECKRVAELAGMHEAEARRAAAVALAAGLERDALEAAQASMAANVQRLEHELAASQRERSAMADEVQRRADFDRTRAAAAIEAEARALEPMPAGVRSCLVALHECLRADGYATVRFLSARALDEEGLHEVEMIDSHADGLSVDVVRAARLVAELDRGRQRLRLRFFDGFRMAAGERLMLPEDGWQLVFEPIDGRMFEARLPALVRADGVYADTASASRGPLPTDLDPMARRQWIERFNRLLADSGTAEELHVNRCRGLADGWFLSVQLIGTDSKHQLLSSADCARLAVEIDAAGGVVSLLLQDGVLRRGGVESTIHTEGYRMLLPKVTAKQATDVMLGMVVNK